MHSNYCLRVFFFSIYIHMNDALTQKKHVINVQIEQLIYREREKSGCIELISIGFKDQIRSDLATRIHWDGIDSNKRHTSLHEQWQIKYCVCLAATRHGEKGGNWFYSHHLVYFFVVDLKFYFDNVVPDYRYLTCMN